MKLILVLLVALLTACGGKSSVKEDFDTDGKVMSRTYKGVDADYALYANKFEALQSQQKPLFELKSVAGQTIKLEGVDSLVVNAPSNAASALRPPAQKPTFMSELRATAAVLIPGLQIAANWDNNNRREETAQVLATVNAQREASIVESVVGLGQSIAAQPPGYVITDSYNDSSDNSATGDTITDSGNTPTTINVSGDGSSVGDGNDVTNGDNNDNSGDLRDSSPGPIDQSDDGDDCSGSSCNPIEPAPPAVPE